METKKNTGLIGLITDKLHHKFRPRSGDGEPLAAHQRAVAGEKKEKPAKSQKLRRLRCRDGITRGTMRGK